MPTPILVPSQQFMDHGWLMEVNRQFFHPRGFALAICATVADDGSTKPAESNGFFLCSLQDWREHGGIEFGEFDAEMRAKAANVPAAMREAESL